MDDGFLKSSHMHSYIAPEADPFILYIRSEPIWVNAILRIVFERITIYCHIAIFDWILVKRHFI